jgi:hypothetical protein
VLFTRVFFFHYVVPDVSVKSVSGALFWICSRKFQLTSAVRLLIFSSNDSSLSPRVPRLNSPAGLLNYSIKNVWLTEVFMILTEIDNAKQQGK